MSTVMNTSLPSRLNQVMEPGRDLFREMREEMDDVLGRLSMRWGTDWLNEPRFTPSMDLSETNDALQIRMDVPGLKPEEVEITVHDDVLTIKAEHREEKTEGTPPAAEGETPAEGESTEGEKKDGNRRFYRRELRYGSFHRSFSLPVGVDADNAEAKFENGVLKLTLPKAEANKPKQIKVGAGSQS